MVHRSPLSGSEKHGTLPRTRIQIHRETSEHLPLSRANYLLLGGCDAISFTGGIGENGINTRKIIAQKLAVLGATFDEEANNCRGKQVVFSKPDSKFKLVVTPTNEELMIAMETVKLTAK